MSACSRVLSPAQLAKQIRLARNPLRLKPPFASSADYLAARAGKLTCISEAQTLYDAAEGASSRGQALTQIARCDQARILHKFPEVKCDKHGHRLKRLYKLISKCKGAESISGVWNAARENGTTERLLQAIRKLPAGQARDVWKKAPDAEWYR